MNIVLPIFFAAVGFGLFARRMTPRYWTAMVLIIVTVIAYHFYKGR